MNKISTEFDGLFVLEPKVHEDARGFFMESYSSTRFGELGLDYNFIQDNHSFNSKKGTFRGMHFQLPPKAQTTYVRVCSGAIKDIVIDIRKGSVTYGKTFSIELSFKNNKQMLIPVGFAHGFLTLSDNVSVLYKMDEVYAPEYDRIINFRDVGVDLNYNELIIAEKDNEAPVLDDVENSFVYGINC